MKKYPVLLLLFLCILVLGCSDGEDNLDELKVVGKWQFVLAREFGSPDHSGDFGNRHILKFTAGNKVTYYTSNETFVDQVNFRMNDSIIIYYGKNEFTGKKWESSPSRYYLKQDTLILRDEGGLEHQDNYYIRKNN